MDSSSSGNLNAIPNLHGNNLQYGSAVLSNSPSLILTSGAADPGGSAVFPSTAAKSVNNIITSGSAPQASGTFTITGAPATGQNNGYTINGTLVNAPQTTGNSVTQQATADVLVINANTTVNKLIVASNIAGVITITALTGGASGNGIAISGTGNAGDTVTASGALLTGGSGVQTAAQPTILQPTTGISVEAWSKPNVIVGGATQILACYGSDATTLAAYNLNHTGSTAVNHTYVFSVNIGGVLKTATAPASTALVVGAGAHVVGTYDGVNVRIFVNGVLQATTAATGAISYASIGAFGLSFGNDGTNTDGNLQGTLDEAAIYGYALSATRIAYHFRQGNVLLPFVWNH